MWFTQAAHHGSAEVDHGAIHGFVVTLVNERDLEPTAMPVAPDETTGRVEFYSQQAFVLLH